MILTDREIKIAIEKGTIVIDPRPAPIAFSSTSVDLTLDATINEFKQGIGGLETTIDPGAPEYNSDAVLKAVTERKTLNETGYLLAPTKFILAWTKEYINLHYHARLAARVEGKSSLARHGLAVHMTAPIIHSGFEGQIRLEVANHGPLPIRLRPGMRFCQLVFELALGTPERGYSGQFSGQSTTSV